MLINSDGVIIRIKADEVSTSGRTTQGVQIMRLDDGKQIVSFAKVVDDENAKKPGAPKKNPNIGSDGNEQMTLL